MTTGKRRSEMRTARTVTHRTLRALLCATVTAVAVATAAPASASAASIVFIKGGNVWLASSDGTMQRQVTTGGGWDSPSQADDGTILAQRGSQLFRINRQGTALAGPIDTTFTGAPPQWAGPDSPVISPDGVHQAYGGMLTDSGVWDPECGCYDYQDQWSTWWGSATSSSQPNQTLGQEDYVDPAWIDDSHLLLTTTGILIDQVATYTLGGPDNSEVQWFSDPAYGGLLSSGVITRAQDKVAFLANENGGTGNEIRLYATTGPPPESSSDPQNAPVDTCNIPVNFQSVRLSFSPDGQSLAYDAPDGIHLITLSGWPGCGAFNDQLIIAGGSLPYFGPADVAPTDGCGACGAGGGGSGGGGSGGGGGGGSHGGAHPRCVVPHLRGLSRTRAQARLRAAHCQLGAVRKRTSRGHPSLVVIAQRPAAGTVLPAGGRVGLTLAARQRKGRGR